MAKRNYTIDLLRLITAFGVITLHVRVDTFEAGIYNMIFWPVCVPFFYVSSLTYFVAGLYDTSVENQYKRTWQRIIIPYLIWTAIYLTLLITKRAIVGEDRPITLWRAILYGESAVHLYFIPTLIFLQTVAASIYLLFVKQNTKTMFGIILLVAATIYFAAGVYYHCFGIGTLGNMAAVLIYMITAFFIAPKIRKENKTDIRLIIGGMLLTIAVIVFNFNGQKVFIGGYPLILPLGGVGLFLMGIGWPVKNITKWLLELCQYSYGIYLCHVLLLEIFEFYLEKTTPAGIIYDFKVKTAVAVSALVISLMIIFCIKQIPLARQLMLGEKK